MAGLRTCTFANIKKGQMRHLLLLEKKSEPCGSCRRDDGAATLIYKLYGMNPKESWALITVLVYMTGLWHGSNGWLKTDRSFNFFCIFAFLSVLFTYFGVNYILGGMHGYA